MIKKRRKIFVSHHHEDAAALCQLKDILALVHIDCFLAHKDIEPGEHDLQRIEEELRNCDAFLYVGGNVADVSAYCQQEIGMAKALKKKIITAKPKSLPLSFTACIQIIAKMLRKKKIASVQKDAPPGFIVHVQAIIFVRIDSNFCNKIRDVLCGEFEKQEIEEHFASLGRECFSKTQKDGAIWLRKEIWNQDTFETLFSIIIDGESVGLIDIGFIGQREHEPTHQKLAENFRFLQLPFFSVVTIDVNKQTVLSGSQILSIKILLNDLDLMSPKDLKKIPNENIYRYLFLQRLAR